MAQAPFPINPALVAIAVDYSQINSTARGYIADIVCPRVRVDGPLFKYPVFKLEEAFTVYDNQVDRLGRLNEITQTATETAGQVIDYGILEKIPYRDEAAMRSASVPFSMKARAVRQTVNVNQLNREIRVANLLFGASSYQTGYKQTLAGTEQWSDYNNSDPVALVKRRKRNMLIPPNIGIMSEGVRDILSLHPKMATALGGSTASGRVLTNEEIARAFGLERIVVANTLRQTSKRGQALVTGPIWGDHFAMIYVPPVGPDGNAIGAESPAFALTFDWLGQVSGENTYRGGEMGLLGGVGVYTGEIIAELPVAPFAGYLFSNAATVPA